MRVTKAGALLLLALFGVTALSAISAPYQEERRIYGKVTDAYGAPLANVNVTLECTPSDPEQSWTEIRQTTTTSNSGEYKFSARGESVDKELPWGLYRLTFKSSGFAQRTTETRLFPSDPDGTTKLVQEVNVQLQKDRQTGRATSPSPAVTASPPIELPQSEGGAPETPRLEPRLTPKPRPTPEAIVKSTPTPSNANVPANASSAANENAAPRPASTPTSAEIDRILKSLDVGNIAFNTPESMSLNEAKKVELLLSTSLSEEALKQEVEKHKVEGNIQSGQIKISDEMEAILTGDGFQITNVLSPRRPISKTNETEWKWDVRALKEGKLRLHLTLNAFVTIGGNPQPYPIRTFDKEYIVVVTPVDKVVSFAKNNWQWLWTTIVLPVGAWLWKRKRRPSEADA